MSSSLFWNTRKTLDLPRLVVPCRTRKANPRRKREKNNGGVVLRASVWDKLWATCASVIFGEGKRRDGEGSGAGHAAAVSRGAANTERKLRRGLLDAAGAHLQGRIVSPD